MIRIQKAETKKVVFTLYEKSDLAVPYYIFELESKDTDATTLFTSVENSGNISRYNSFTFSEGSTATFSGGFDLEVGQYNYTVYETPTTLSIDTSTASVVEIGLLEVVGTQSLADYDDYTDVDDDRDYTYNG